MQILWFLEPNLSLVDITARLVAAVFMVVWFLPIHEITHLWVYRILIGEKNRIKDIDLFELFDPMGSLCMVILNYGWAKNIIPWNYLSGRTKTLVALAGPVFNFVCAVCLGLIHNIFALISSIMLVNLSWVLKFLLCLIDINIMLTAFNLLPLPAFDGFKVFESFIPEKYLEVYYKNYFFINVGMILLLTLGFFNIPLMFVEITVRKSVFMLSSLPFMFIRGINI